MFIMMNNAWLLLTMVIDDYCRDSSIEFVDFPSHVGKITQGLPPSRSAGEVSAEEGPVHGRCGGQRGHDPG